MKFLIGTGAANSAGDTSATNSIAAAAATTTAAIATPTATNAVATTTADADGYETPRNSTRSRKCTTTRNGTCWSYDGY